MEGQSCEIPITFVTIITVSNGADRVFFHERAQTMDKGRVSEKKHPITDETAYRLIFRRLTKRYGDG